MSINLPSHYAMQFSNTIQLLLQQKGSKFRGLCMEGPHSGKMASPVDQIGSIAANKVTSRFGPKTRQDAPIDRRWVYPVDYDSSQLADSFDLLKTSLDNYNSSYYTNALYAMGRAIDDEFVTALFGTAKTGEQGGTSTSFDATNQVVSVSLGGTTSNLNVEKLLRAKRILTANEVDLEFDPIYCAITAAQEEALYKEIQVVSSEFNSKPLFDEGKLKYWNGINFVHSERLINGTDDAAGTSRQVPMWAKSGMYIGIWKDVVADIDVRKDLQNNPWEVYLMMSIGATRLEEKKAVKIWCRE